MPYEVIHAARRQITNLPGGKLRPQLVPKGMDPRVVDDQVRGWSEK